MTSDHAQWARRLRNRADECRALANVVTDENNRRAYLQLAESYETLAVQEERLGLDILKPPVRTA